MPDLRVLVVDDAADLRLLIALVLEEEPDWVLVGEAGDGKEAIEKARRLRPDLVLLDAAMPVMDGLEALPDLRDLLPDGVLVMLTAFPRGSLEEAAAEAGADAVLDKMNLAEDLVPALRELTRDAGHVGTTAKNEVEPGAALPTARFR
jgi:CheY-like chemotaxis protein